MNIKWVGAHKNNYQVGRAGYTVKYIFLHWIVGTLESADATFANKDRIASATYGIGDNDIHQYVKEEDTSYANGNLASNRESITIEHEGGWDIGGGNRFKPTPATHETSAQLVADICKRYKIPVDRTHIKKHNEISATQCPGTLDVDWIVNRAKEINTPASPAITNQTQIPQIYNWEVQKIKSEVDRIPGLEKDLENSQKTASTLKAVEDKYLTQIDVLNGDVKKVTEDFKKYKEQQVEQKDYKGMYETLQQEFADHIETHATAPKPPEKQAPVFPEPSFTIAGYNVYFIKNG